MTAQALATAIAANGYDRLSAELVKECVIVTQEDVVANDAQTLTTEAAVLKLPALSDRQLIESILASS